MNNITFIYLQELLKLFSLSEDVLPKILPSADDFGKVIDGSTLNGIPISGVSRLNYMTYYIHTDKNVINKLFLRSDNRESAVVFGWSNMLRKRTNQSDLS